MPDEMPVEEEDPEEADVEDAGLFAEEEVPAMEAEQPAGEEITGGAEEIPADAFEAEPVSTGDVTAEEAPEV